MSNFWERQRAKQNPQPPVSSPTAAWWARGSDVLAGRQTAAQNPSQGRTDTTQTDPNIVEGHDVSRIGLLKGGAAECPVCLPNPDTGIRGNMYRPSPSVALRCFDCGYREDNRFEGETSGLIAIREGPAQRARQTDSGGKIINNYKGNITSARQAEGRIS